MANLPYLLLSAKIRTFVAQLLNAAIGDLEVLCSAATFYVDPCPLVEKVLIPLSEILNLTPMHRELLLVHPMAVCTKGHVSG